MKTRTLLIAAVMFLGLAAASFAQATFSVGSIPVTQVVQTGLTEKSGDITFTQVSGTSITGTISINYLVPITSPFPTEGGAVVSVTGTGGYLGTVSVNTTASNHAAGILVINVPGLVASAVPNPTITISGVRVVAPSATLNATLSSTGNAITAGQTSVLVIAAVGPGIFSVNANPPAPATQPSSARVNGTTGLVYAPSTSTPLAAPGGVAGNIVIKEGALNSWNDINSLLGTPAGTGFQFTLSALPASGVTIRFPSSVTTNGLFGPTFYTYNSSRGRLNTNQDITSGSSSLSVYYRLESTTDPTTQESVTIPITVLVDSAVAVLPLASQAITFTVTMWPTGTAFNSDGTVITTTSLVPRFTSTPIGPYTLYQVITSNTTILFPFVQSAIAAGNYNTGFAIANTTLDPGTAATGFTSPMAQNGTITFWFFPQQPSPTVAAPAPWSYTTNATSPGTGLDATGKLPAGSTYTVLLTQLLAAAGKPADFAGNMYAIVSATNCHGLFVLSNFTTFSQGGLGLIIANDRTVAPEALNN